MARIFFLIIFILFHFNAGLRAGLIISEFTTGATEDWVELTLAGTPEKMDIATLYVTMYYGTNEQLGTDPITIYAHDRPETPYDDRYVVVYLTRPDTPDETDLTGDTNGNGRIDVYCNNYFASLWNTEGVVAVDSDDDPSNGGILDFVYYSSRDGEPNDTMASYVAAAQANGEWQACPGENIQDCSVSIGREGLAAHMSVCRRKKNDSNSAADFSVTSILTPGKPNIAAPLFMGNRLFTVIKKKITIIPGHGLFGSGIIPVFVFAPCALRLRVFTITGIVIHESPRFLSVRPGLFNLFWNPLLQRRAPASGLYLCKIEAVSTARKSFQEEIIKIIVSRYR
ncbi:MAG: hypothetical protein JW807_16585 [Spirochaetes bacterium]|nr:hypothetical protein [Spirochaetota bacterium]